MAVNRDELEAFVLDGLKNTLCDPFVIGKCEEQLGLLARTGPETNKQEIAMIEESLGTNAAKQNRILSAIEEGAPRDVCMERLEELAAEKGILQQRLEIAYQRKQQEIDIEDTAALVRAFLEAISRDSTELSFDQKKELIRRCIGKIVVDGKKKQVQCFVRRIPVVNRASAGLYEGLEETKKAPDKAPFRTAVVAGTQCTHDRKVISLPQIGDDLLLNAIYDVVR